MITVAVANKYLCCSGMVTRRRARASWRRSPLSYTSTPLARTSPCITPLAQTGLISEELISIRISQHRPVPTQGDCLWALALTFRNAASVAVALGELVDDVPSYLPDSLVVLFGQEVAESYRISSSPTSAWGDEIA